jgi:hypothetical protein
MTTAAAILTALMAPAALADPYPLYAEARQLERTHCSAGSPRPERAAGLPTSWQSSRSGCR